jgi:uncharacterized protein YgbK (DUF1537 family)
MGGIVLVALADDFTGATDPAGTLVRGGMRTAGRTFERPCESRRAAVIGRHASH